MRTDIPAEPPVSSSTKPRLTTVASGEDAVDRAATPIGMASPATGSGSAMVTVATAEPCMTVTTLSGF